MKSITFDWAIQLVAFAPGFVGVVLLKLGCAELIVLVLLAGFVVGGSY